MVRTRREVLISNRGRWFLLTITVLLVIVAAMFGALGASLQTLAFQIALFSGFATFVELLLMCAMKLFASRRTYSNDAALRVPEPAADDALKTSVDSCRAEETALAFRYREGSCSAEDVVRARAIRLQAEIAWIRHTSVLGRSYVGCR